MKCVRREGSGNYLLKGVDGTEYSRPPQVLKLVAPEIVKDLRVENTIFAAVKEIVDHREFDGITYYRTRWEKGNPSQDSWLRKEDFIDYGPVQKYDKLKAAGGQKHVKGQIEKKKEEKQSEISKKKVAKAGDRKLAEFNQQLVESAVDVPAIPVVIDLDIEQMDAIGNYWRNMRKSRAHKPSIVESDED